MTVHKSPVLVDPKKELPLIDDTVYSNLFNEYNEDVIAQVTTGLAYAQHAAWDFCGYVWFSDGVWCESVWVHRKHVATYMAGELRELIWFVNDTHGWR